MASRVLIELGVEYLSRESYNLSLLVATGEPMLRNDVIPAIQTQVPGLSVAQQSPLAAMSESELFDYQFNFSVGLGGNLEDIGDRVVELTRRAPGQRGEIAGWAVELTVSSGWDFQSLTRDDFQTLAKCLFQKMGASLYRLLASLV